MKTKILGTLMMLTAVFADINGQTIAPGKQTIDKIEYYGYNLSSSIQEKYLNTYWKTYLGKFGKVRSKKGAYQLQRSYIPNISAGPVDLTSTIQSSKNISTLFMALNVNGAFITNNTDSNYASGEKFLREFLDYATGQEQIRVVETDFTDAEKNHKKLVKDSERITRDIERAEKELQKLKDEQVKVAAEIESANTFLQNKQKDVEATKSKVPKL